jgi:hypothetical protein
MRQVEARPVRLVSWRNSDRPGINAVVGLGAGTSSGPGSRAAPGVPARAAGGAVRCSCGHDAHGRLARGADRPGRVIPLRLRFFAEGDLP